MAWRVVGPILAVALLSACTTTVRGNGVGDSGRLHCPSGAVTDHGAPFCYRLPSGFTDDSALDTYGSDWPYRTLVVVAPYDLVEVLADRLDFDSDIYPDGQLRTYAEGRLVDFASTAQRTLTGVTPTRVAQVRAFELTVSLQHGATERAIFAYRGHTEVFIQCLQRDEPRAAKAGCAAVLRSIQIIDLR